MRGRHPLGLLVALTVALCFVLPSAADAQRRKKKKKKRKDKETVSAPKDKAAENAATPDDTPKDPAAKATIKSKKRGKTTEKEFDFTGLDLSGSMRMPQLLYFLDRANEELERASLERRSFIPEMVRSLDEAAL
jgi:hypothetical protein